MVQINPRVFELDPNPNSAVRLVNSLGQLARWMVNDRVLQLANLLPVERPPAPSRIGCCWPLIGIRNVKWQQWLLPAVVIPVQWRVGNEHDKGLPLMLRKCADEVLRAVGRPTGHEYSIGFPQLGSNTVEWPRFVRFGKEQLEADSCFAALLQGWYSLDQGAQPDPSVFASAAWQGEFTSVDLLEEKLAAVRTFGGKTLFVSPLQNIKKETSREFSDIEIFKFDRRHNAHPKTSASKYLAQSLLKPDSDEWAPCRDYHAATRAFDRNAANHYYDSDLFPHILVKCNDSILASSSVGSHQRVTHFVTIATGTPQPVRVLLGVFEPTHVLILHTGDFEESARRITQQCLDTFSNLAEENMKTIEFPYRASSSGFPSDFVSAFAQHIAEFTDGVDDECVVFDIDRGLTLHKFALLNYVIKPDHLIASLYHEMDHRNLIRHGSERVIVWKKGDDWRQAFEKCSDV